MANKATAKKAPAKKAPAKKAPVKAALAKKQTAKKAPVRKATAKTAPVKKAPVKKTPAKKAPAKKPSTTRSSTERRTSAHHIVEHPNVVARAARGKAARAETPRASHNGWEPAADRPDPVALIEEQNRTRVPDLVPVRHGRMMVSPFTFYRGAAKIMATDLKDTPRAGLIVQLCGDAHLSNFGVFASPERNLLFDLNDFDETLPGPFEYDVLRMTASFTIAARNNGFNAADIRSVTLEAVRSYREGMAQFAAMRTMDIWYARMTEQEMLKAMDMARATQKDKAARKAAKGLEKTALKNAAKARSRDSMQALSKLAELVDGQYRIISQPPIVIPVRDLAESLGLSSDDVQAAVLEQLRSYRESLQDDRRRLLERFEVVDVAHKVVGVGSVGNRAFIALLQGRDEQDPLFLQVKEATASVLEDHLPKSVYEQPGERVVQGQRMMQAASDIFLGWTKGVQADRYLYWRQLRDMKGSAIVEAMVPMGMTFYAHACGWTLARAHARSGDPVAIAAYLGKSDTFDRAVTDFSNRYADQNEKDYEAFLEAVHTGWLEAREGV
ncbi:MULTISPECIES: DUF2252 domain-containing protein [Cryobacterium]|uniref:DUF2252 domain-containing protein n=1 Tax=Cryobacterium TaxID=69578 RepID=UPI000CD45CE3|nr:MULTISPECIES: DUF2252 domain-containing protein [Cryobacterium]POH66139.1 DUF2252 domain-containing protein [Cryobacterium zongtaii]TFC46811.1 DUF2252 domain-containing protein [Cryobacterium sp. TMN-39-2]